MLKVTPYLGIIVLIVSVGGIFYPKLGYFLLLVFASLMIIAPFRGLKSTKTRQAARSGEFYISRLLPHGATEAWIEAGRPDIYSRARQTVSEILEGPVKDPLPENVAARLDDILERADRELAG